MAMAAMRRQGGPSPRIRGESQRRWPSQPLRRTIPANTGRIPWPHIAALSFRDHPREYGENDMPIPGVDIHPGPSPRIRGEFITHGCGGDFLGTIPANTGRIHLMVSIAQSRWDHPREYGENLSRRRKGSLFWGPSPRIRGEFPRSHRPADQLGTIPANTGRI